MSASTPSASGEPSLSHSTVKSASPTNDDAYDKAHAIAVDNDKLGHSVHDGEKYDSASSLEDDNDSMDLSTEPQSVPQAILHTPQRIWSYLFHRDYHIHLLGLYLMFMFIGYQPLQALQTIRYPQIGSYNLAVLYGVFGLNSWMAPLYIELLGPTLCLPVCGLFMIVFPFTLMANNNVASVLGAASHGFGTGFLWPSAGRVISSISTHRDESTNSAIYQSYYRSAAGIGGLIYAVLNSPSSTFNSRSQWNAQYGVFAGSEAIGIFMGFVLWFSYTRSMKKKNAQLSAQMHTLIEELTAQGNTEDAERVRQSLQQKKLDLGAVWGRLKHHWQTTFKLMCTWEYLPLALLQFSVCGVQQSWFTANFNLALSKLSVGQNSQGVSWLGWMQAIDQCFAIFAATCTGLVLEWARKTYDKNPRRLLWPAFYGVAGSWIAYGLAIECVHAYAEVGVVQYNWNYYFGLMFVTCFFYWSAFMATEVSFYVWNISLFGPISGSAFSLRVFFEGMGNMTGFLANTALGSTESRKLWSAINYGVTLPGFMALIFLFRLPKHYTAHDMVKQKFVTQKYQFESEAIDIAQRESAARVRDGQTSGDSTPTGRRQQVSLPGGLAEKMGDEQFSDKHLQLTPAKDESEAPTARKFDV